PRRVERSGLEGLIEPVHINEHIAVVRTRCEKIVNARDRLHCVELPIAQANRGEREATLIGRYEARPRNGHVRGALGSEPGFRLSAIHRLARRCDQQSRTGGKLSALVTCKTRGEGGTAAKRRQERKQSALPQQGTT